MIKLENLFMRAEDNKLRIIIFRTKNIFINLNTNIVKIDLDTKRLFQSQKNHFIFLIDFFYFILFFYFIHSTIIIIKLLLSFTIFYGSKIIIIIINRIDLPPYIVRDTIKDILIFSTLTYDYNTDFISDLSV